jgi:hypothetical protein
MKMVLWDVVGGRVGNFGAGEMGILMGSGCVRVQASGD